MYLSLEEHQNSGLCKKTSTSYKDVTEHVGDLNDADYEPPS